MTANEPDETASSTPDWRKASDEVWDSGRQNGKNWLKQKQDELVARGEIPVPRLPGGGYHVASPIQAAAVDLSNQMSAAAARYKKLKAEVDAAKKEQEGTVAEKYPKLGEQLPAAEVARENIPRCKTHRTRMKYNAAEDTMECPEDGCTNVARKRRSFRDLVGADVGSNPAVYRGEMEFVTDDEGTVYLFLPGANAMISLAAIYAAHQPPRGTDTSEYINRFMATVRGMEGIAKETIVRQKRQRQLAREADEAESRMRERQAEVQGTTKLYGIPLPPHLGNTEAASKIAAVYTRMESEGIGEGYPREERVAAAIEACYPSRRRKGGIVVLQYFTAYGKNIYAENSTVYGDNLSLLNLCVSTLNSLEGEYALAQGERPLYVMLDGKALTKTGCAALLRAEKGASQRVVRRYLKDGTEVEHHY